jgi:hypothetical protein
VPENSSLVHGIGFVICTDFGADYGCSMVVVGLGFDDLALMLFDFGRRGFEHFHIDDVVSTVYRRYTLSVL